MTEAPVPRAPFVALASLAVALVAIGAHAKARSAARDRETPAIHAVSRLLPHGDLAIAGGARHLRFPTLEEPGAAFSEGPGSPDQDPAGGALAPPIELYVETALTSRRAPSP